MSELKDILWFLEQIPEIQREILEFKRQFRNREVQIRPFQEYQESSHAQASFYSSFYQGVPLSAFHYNGVEKVIFLDWSIDPAVLAPIFYHELVHSQDTAYLRRYHWGVSLWEKFQKECQRALEWGLQNTKKTREDLTLQDCPDHYVQKVLDCKKRWEKFESLRSKHAEKLAFKKQKKLIESLVKQIPGYREQIQSHTEFHSVLLADQMTEARIYRRYGF